MEKCVACQFYDRGNSQSDSRGIQWGQCRRSAPRLHPVNQKSFMIEGVWPHVRDDDWCGDWKATARRAESRPGLDFASSSPLTGVPAMPARPGAMPTRPDVLLARPGATPARPDVLLPAAATRIPTAPGGPLGTRPAAAASVSALNAHAGATPAAAAALGSLRVTGRSD